MIWHLGVSACSLASLGRQLANRLVSEAQLLTAACMAGVVCDSEVYALLPVRVQESLVGRKLLRPVLYN
jgi:hypothetical protein